MHDDVPTVDKNVVVAVAVPTPKYMPPVQSVGKPPVAPGQPSGGKIVKS